MNVNNNNEINIESKTMSMLLITVPYDIFIRKRWNVFFVLKDIPPFSQSYMYVYPKYLLCIGSIKRTGRLIEILVYVSH